MSDGFEELKAILHAYPNFRSEEPIYSSLSEQVDKNVRVFHDTLAACSLKTVRNVAAIAISHFELNEDLSFKTVEYAFASNKPEDPRLTERQLRIILEKMNRASTASSSEKEQITEELCTDLILHGWPRLLASLMKRHDSPALEEAISLVSKYSKNQHVQVIKFKTSVEEIKSLYQEAVVAKTKESRKVVAGKLYAQALRWQQDGYFESNGLFQSVETLLGSWFAYIQLKFQLTITLLSSGNWMRPAAHSMVTKGHAALP
ncbi:hypothetical protein E1B28_003356 [Marasmius oreades]|uniref:Uncharacterized protein n=1 Tax=Marasmius oreades TaxID=181124 RepID=A0A9P7UKG8_9AGAR|nr:uncharacterized protein E1B28_003356 [Marasmius oreades]KAG7085818.1 hypothetical protein E1B28_003356 [Marasmius oreades]